MVYGLVVDKVKIPRWIRESNLIEGVDDPGADEKCLKAWWAKPYYLLEVKDKDISDLNFTFHHRCFVPGDIPCINYIGPMPP